jgi:hypothetical protein
MTQINASQAGSERAADENAFRPIHRIFRISHLPRPRFVRFV